MAAAADQNLPGTSLALSDGDLVLAGGDLALVSGSANFAQALQVIIGTPFGSDQINVNYGLDVAAIFVAANSVRSIKDVIRLNIVKSLATDDRIREIQEILFDDEPGFASLAPEFAGADPGATARHGRLWHAVVSLATAGGQQQVVVLGASP
jgi:hypothetical protein